MVIFFSLVMGLVSSCGYPGEAPQERTAESPPPPTLSAEAYSTLLGRAEAGDLSAAEEALRYMAQRSDVFSDAEQDHIAEVAARAGSELGSQLHILDLLSDGDCRAARAGLRRYEQMHPSSEGIGPSRTVVEAKCGPAGQGR